MIGEYLIEVFPSFFFILSHCVGIIGYMDMFYRVYLITNKIDKKQYVGITTKTIAQRWYLHTIDSSTCRYLKHAIKKYSKENFSIQEICNAFTEKDLEALEFYFIRYYNTLAPNGYNLREGGYNGKFSEASKLLCKESQKERWTSEEEHKRYSEIWKKKWANERSSPQFQKMDEQRKIYIENKKEKIIGVSIEDGSVIRYTTILQARENGFCPDQVLAKKGNSDHGYTWFYDEGQEESFFLEEAKKIIGEFGTYCKIKNSWDKCDYDSRIKSMKESAKHRRKAIVGVSRFDLSIIEFESVNDVIRAGYTWGSVNQSITRKCKHAYNYCWFYKKEDINYVEEAKQILGNKLDNTNMSKVIANNPKTGEQLTFNNLYEAEKVGFKIREIRRCLRENRSHLGYVWKFV